MKINPFILILLVLVTSCAKQDQVAITFRIVKNSENSPEITYVTFSNTSSSGHNLAYAGTSNMTSYSINKLDNIGRGSFSGTAQLYSIIAGLPVSIAVSLSGTYEFSQPASPQSPSLLRSTFKATEPTIFPW